MRQHIRTSLGYMRRSPFQALAAVVVLMVTFLVSTFLIVLVFASNQVLDFFETRPQIIVFLKDEVGEGDIEELKSRLGADSRVTSVVFVSKEEALEIYKTATSDNPLLGELVSPSIFPASIEFSLTDLSFAQEVIDEVKSWDSVESVSFTASLGGESSLSSVIERLKTITNYIRLGGFITMLILALTSFLVLTVVISMRVTVRRGEIESLSLLGATSWFIRAPIVLEAINYAIIGVTMGWVFASVILMYLTPSILRYFGEIPVLPKESVTFFAMLGAIYGIELMAGIVIAFLGSWVAVSRSLRMVK